MARPPLLRRFARSDRGVVLVEFAMVLPLLLIIFAIIIEGGRMMWSYQTAIAGVRDAARYVGRVVPSDICTTGRPISDYVTINDLKTIIQNSIEGTESNYDIDEDKYKVLPSRVEIDTYGAAPVTATHTCVAGTYRVSPAPVVTVSARIRIEFPFEGIFRFAADGIDPFILTTISDETRVYGS